MPPESELSRIFPTVSGVGNGSGKCSLSHALICGGKLAGNAGQPSGNDTENAWNSGLFPVGYRLGQDTGN